MSPVKRNANDRNQLAIDKAAQTAAIKSQHITLSTGVGLTLLTIDYMVINQIQMSVEIPEVPTYETKTAGGRVEYYPMDAKVVEQSPEFAEEWRDYRRKLGAALQEQAQRTSRAMFLDGTKPDEGWFDNVWERRMRLLKVKLPTDPDDKWLLYLETGLDSIEAAELVMKIMRLTTLPEELIQAAEDTFRDTVRADEGRGELEVAGATA